MSEENPKQVMNSWGQSKQLFVYGSLRRRSDHPMATWLHQHARFIESTTIRAKLYDLGEYPALSMDADSTTEVVGDLVELPLYPELLAALDQYEGVSIPPKPIDDYRRELVTLSRGKLNVQKCWLYVWNGMKPPGTLIPSGDWLSWQRAKLGPGNRFT